MTKCMMHLLTRKLFVQRVSGSQAESGQFSQQSFVWISPQIVKKKKKLFENSEKFNKQAKAVKQKLHGTWSLIFIKYCPTFMVL